MLSDNIYVLNFDKECIYTCANHFKKQTTLNMAEESKKKNVMELTFADAESMNRYVTETGKILPRKFTGLSSKEQRHIKKTIKHARNMLLMK
ncbi:MAG: 30S ribosomal protein S18 [Verrucomicrobiaceae bacterium]|nr:30S ribosomal protein S18 [Verrucomicrobiaceae bacterium]